MTARDDYPHLANRARPNGWGIHGEIALALDEIDLLRAAVATRDSADTDFRDDPPFLSQWERRP